MRETTIQKDLDSIWLTLRLEASYRNWRLKEKFEKPVEMHFRIRTYSDDGSFRGYRDDWRVFDVSIYSRENVMYFPGSDEILIKFGEEFFRLHDDESMEDGELEYLEKAIKRTLNGRPTRIDEWYEPLENVFCFYAGNSITDKSPYLHMEIYGSTGYVKLFLKEKEMRLFSSYLKLKRRALSLNDKKIRSMFREGYLYREEREFYKKDEVFSVKNPELENAIKKYRNDNSIENAGTVYKAIGCGLYKKLIVNCRWVGNEIQYELVTREGDENKKFIIVYTSYETFLADEKNRDEMWRPCAIDTVELLSEICQYGDNYDGISLSIDNYGIMISKENLNCLLKRGYNLNFLYPVT